MEEQAVGEQTQPSSTILETRNLTKDFKGFTAISDVSINVKTGSIHALIGPNGAGKTTFFNLLTKFLKPSAGQIIYAGKDITNAPRGYCPAGSDSLFFRFRRYFPIFPPAKTFESPCNASWAFPITSGGRYEFLIN